ncbi:MAG: ATP-binding cassette domain-containing protein [Thiomargarita sp.]|nr:ATP-binding cassette domain-containing protein [Thiomargarita sp.]
MVIQGKKLNLISCEEEGQNLYPEDINFSLNEEEIVLLYGPSASGKTVLFQLLTGLLIPTTGELLWNEIPIKKTTIANEQRHQYITTIFSTFYFLTGLSVKDNIMLPALFVNMSQKDIDKRLAYLSEIFDFSQEDGLQRLCLKTLLTYKNVNALSNGQKEMVSIARALMLDSKFIFADELLRSFPTYAETKIWDKLLSIIRTEKKSLFMITHKPHLKDSPGIDQVFDLKDSVLNQLRKTKDGWV